MTIHYHREAHPDMRLPDPHQDAFSRVTLGFWIYLMTDCLIFGTLFATYAVLHNSTFGGPSGKDLFSLSTAFAETMVLLLSSVTSGLGLLAALKNKKNQAVFWLIFAFLFGASFIVMELTEFHKFAHEGHDWTQAAFLSSFFTLVGTHGLHVSIGLTWMAIMIAQIFFLGVTIDTFRRLVVFSLFWHFLDLVWIFIFTFVYLIGVS
jgi:cytochrome o ubiquinol oxidase subunit 3